MSDALLLRELERVVEAPDSMQALRPFIVEMALRGDLTRSDRKRLGPEPVSLERIFQGMVILVRTRSKYNWSRAAQARTRPKLDAPEGWCATELGNTGLYVNGLPFKPSDWGHKGRPIIRIQNLSGFNRNYNYTDGDFPPDNLVEAGDLLVSWSATLDTFLWDGPPGVVNQHIYKVVPNPEAVTREFLYWLLKQEVRQLALGQYAHGLAMMHINRGPFLSHLVRLPPIVEQRRIVAKVDELMVLCDQLEAAQEEREARRDGLRAASLHRLAASDGGAKLGSAAARFFLDTSPKLITKPEHVAAIRETVLDLAVHGRLVPGDLKSWNHTTLGKACSKITDGTHRTPTYVDSGVPFVSVKDFSSGRLNFGSTRHISQEEHVRLVQRCNPERGDILIGRIGTLGKPVVVDTDREFSLFVSVGLLKPRRDIVAPEYLRMFLDSPTASAAFDRIKVGGGTHTNKLNLADLRDLLLALPPRDEQMRIVAKVDELMALLNHLEAALASVQDGRARLMESVLHEALEGAGTPIVSGMERAG